MHESVLPFSDSGPHRKSPAHTPPSVHALRKIAALKQYISNRPITIEVDGGINLTTGADCMAHGADVLVAGSAIFKAENPTQYIKKLRTLGE